MVGDFRLQFFPFWPRFKRLACKAKSKYINQFNQGNDYLKSNPPSGSTLKLLHRNRMQVNLQTPLNLSY
jgi:hypothetical protein